MQSGQAVRKRRPSSLSASPPALAGMSLHDLSKPTWRMEISSIIGGMRLPHVSAWMNNDVRPVETARRTWTFGSFHNFWLLINCNISTFLGGSALIPLGLTWWQATICIIIGNLVATGALLLNSVVGCYYHIGFPVYSRAVWGMWGSQFSIWNRIFLSIVWYGFQSWTGGQCFYLVMLALDPEVDRHISRHHAPHGGRKTAHFVAYLVFCVVSLPFIYIRPHRLQWFLRVSSAITIVFYTVLLIWALATMGPGGFGTTITDSTPNPVQQGPKSTAWVMVSGIVATVGAIAAGILNQNDYTRMARSTREATWGQAFSYPFYSILTSMIGILVVAATQTRLGSVQWYLPDLLAELMLKNPTAAGRAAVFFSGLALTVAQVGSNVPGNALAGGIDMATVFPRYINIRRGAYITAIVSPVVNPWRLVDSAQIFLSVLSGYSVFLAPMTGMMVASYYLVHRQKIDVDSLYRGNASSIYWFWRGINWRAPVAWVIGVAPCMPGFVMAVNTNVTVPDGAQELYMMSYFYGFLSSGFVFVLLHRVWPARAVDRFVHGEQTAKEVQAHYERRWDIELHETEVMGPDYVGDRGAESEMRNKNDRNESTGGGSDSTGRPS